MFVAASIVEYLKLNRLVITTAESCTAGKIITLISEVDGGGHVFRVVMSSIRQKRKQRLLKVRPYTINIFNLTSCEVAREMVLGALGDSPANVAIATTGILGPDVIDGITLGTVCFDWAYRLGRGLSVFCRKERFMGSRQEVQLAASLHALKSLPHFHQLAIAGEGA
ncbi:nicotinamide-nucleotide amidohydrolase family protein [Pseudomonas sp. SIMBA_041]|uniref:CinA family protein n=1 Tax=Pseudomonas sp. SIMBA_041 TaxID=3085782 RepID=UPI003979E5D1